MDFVTGLLIAIVGAVVGAVLTYIITAATLKAQAEANVRQILNGRTWSIIEEVAPVFSDILTIETIEKIKNDSKNVKKIYHKYEQAYKYVYIVGGESVMRKIAQPMGRYLEKLEEFSVERTGEEELDLLRIETRNEISSAISGYRELRINFRLPFISQ